MTKSIHEISPTDYSDQMLPTPHITTVEASGMQPPQPGYLTQLNNEFPDSINGVSGPHMPLTALYKRIVELAQENTHDARTGLLDRKGMAQWYEKYGPDKMLIIKGDGIGFGMVNKQYGHLIGDEVIEYIGTTFSSRLSTRLSSLLRTDTQNTTEQEGSFPARKAKDAFGISREGGDEFFAIVNLDDVPDEDVEKVTAAILGRLRDFGEYKFKDDNGVEQSIPVQIRSVGILGRKDDGKSLEDYQAEVDTALLEATKIEKAKQAE